MKYRPCLLLLLVTALLVMPVSMNAQKTVRKSIRQGNSAYKKEKFTEAEISYLKALEANPKSTLSTYNLGNALFKQKKTKEALEKYQVALNQEKSTNNKASILHNTGDCYMELRDYSNAVNSFKSALRLNPADDETRYNLAVAQALLQKQQQDKKKDKDDKKDKGKGKDKGKDKDKKDQEQQQDDQQKKQQDQKDQQQQQQQEQVSKEKAQQLLDALMQDEKETQDKVKKLQMQQSRAKNPEKDW